MLYEEAVETKVTREQAEAEVRRKGHDPVEMLRDLGRRSMYVGGDILQWLGLGPEEILREPRREFFAGARR